MPRITKGTELEAKRFIAQLIRDRKDEIAGSGNKPSVVKIQRIMKSEISVEISRPTITKWVTEEDLTKYLEINTYDNNNQVKEYDELMRVAKTIWNDPSVKPSDRAKAQNSYLRAKKQKEDLLMSLAEQELKQYEAEQPNYLITFTPGSAKRKCPKCGHEFYDMGKKKDDKKTEDSNTE